jgi:SAM-dependent methyltransferase
MDNPSLQYWQHFARQWQRLSSPMRPCAEDVAIMQRNLSNTGLNLLLGVTPELTGLPCNLVALDNSAAMIGALWPGDSEARHVVLGDWLDMPFESQYFDNVIGDGSTVLLSYPDQYASLFEQVGRVIKPGGRVLIRFFLRPEQGETCAAVCAEAMAGRIRGFHAFKWRLSMALAAETDDPNIRVAETLTTFDRLLPDRSKLAEASGWSLEDIETIDFYSESGVAYSYPTLSELRRTLPPQFRELGIECGSYELATCCPTMIMECRA